MAWLRPTSLAKLSQTPPKKRAQDKFSNGTNGSWMPNKIDDNLKYTKKMTMPKYTNACGAEISSVFLSNTKMIDATTDAFV